MVLHLHTQLKDGHCKIALYTLLSNGIFAGPEFAETELKKGQITFEILIPGMDEICTFDIHGAKARYRNVVEITGETEKGEFPVLALYRRATTY